MRQTMREPSEESDTDTESSPPRPSSTSKADLDDSCAYWRDEAYWRLPANVRHAVDVAKVKSKHSEFWYRLQALNDKIFVFRSIFYTKMPSYQRAFLKKKQKILEEKLRR